VITWAQLRAKLRERIWTFPGEPKSLRKAHDAAFVQGAIELQRWVECLQVHNTTIYPFCSTFFECGKTVVEFPQGQIRRAYTIANGEWCDKVFYDSAGYNEVEQWAHDLLTFVGPLNVGYPKLPQGMRYAEAASDSVVGRARLGIWAWHNERFYLAPWIQSNEQLVLEWDGVRKTIGDEDVFDDDLWTEDVLEALESYVRWKHEDKFGTTGAAEVQRIKAIYDNQLAVLMWDCREKKRKQLPQSYPNQRVPTSAEVKDDAVPVDAQPVFAYIADFGQNQQSLYDVAAQLLSWGPQYIVTGGDNWYGSSLVQQDLDDVSGRFFKDFMFPYLGTYPPSSARENAFYACIGNHDRDPVGRLDIEKTLFNLKANYYDFVRGPVHWFIYDSGYDNSQVNQEAAGVDVNSAQAQWLRAKLQLSTSKWKIVVFHHPPYSSTQSAAQNENSVLVPPLAGDGTLSYPSLRLPLKDWGADVLLNGHSHNYERLQWTNGFPQIICGGGGGDILRPFTTPLAISKTRYNADFGALRGTATCDSLKFEFVTRTGVVIETFTLTK
jgi:hypothetical protein